MHCKILQDVDGRWQLDHVAGFRSKIQGRPKKRQKEYSNLGLPLLYFEYCVMWSMHLVMVGDCLTNGDLFSLR